MQKTEYMEGFRIIHTTPDLKEQEIENLEQEIALKIYNLFSNKNNCAK